MKVLLGFCFVWRLDLGSEEKEEKDVDVYLIGTFLREIIIQIHAIYSMWSHTIPTLVISSTRKTVDLTTKCLIVASSDQAWLLAEV